MVSKMWIHDNFAENEQVITGEVAEYDYGTTIAEVSLTNL